MSEDKERNTRSPSVPGSRPESPAGAPEIKCEQDPLVHDTTDLNSDALNSSSNALSTSICYGLMFGKRESRRTSDPIRAQQLWDAIKAVRAQKQIPAITRISRYMNRYYRVVKDETQKLLDIAVSDNLIKLELKIGTKGHKSGIEEKAYRLPTSDMLSRERHDWYCFQCHSGGEVLLCAGCHRVFHEHCLKSEASAAITDINFSDEVDDRQEWYCIACKITQLIPHDFEKRERKDLNHLLRLVCRKIKDKTPANILYRDLPQNLNKSNSIFDPSSANKSPQLPGVSNINSENEEPWRATFLLKQQISVLEMENKCISNQYRILEEFRTDLQLLTHNIVIYHGANSTLADTARQMLRDCSNDLREINQCRDCFRYANEVREKYWFCKPCRPSHELVYAKQKGFPYWPAKVMSKDDNSYDVKFFGGYHQKAHVEKNHIKPISVNIHTLQVKRTSLWNKACEELRRYQELVTKFENTEAFTRDCFGDPFAGGEIKSEIHDTNNSQNANNDWTASGSDGEVSDTEERKRELLLNASTNIKKDLNDKKKKRKLKKIKKDDSENCVSSSSQETRFVTIGIQTPSKLLKKSGEDRKSSTEELRQIIEKMRNDFDQEKKRAVNVATRSLERDLERLKADHATELEEMTEYHKQKISEVKKKQWCFNCEKEAIYWCCWNTAYCSIDCQNHHWHKEHKKNCRRKR